MGFSVGEGIRVWGREVKKTKATARAIKPKAAARPNKISRRALSPIAATS